MLIGRVGTQCRQWKLRITELVFRVSLFRRYVALVPVVFSIVANLTAWIVCLILLRPHPRLLGPAVLAYTYGLRHALDADHISAIDNLTRRLLEEGQRPVSVGLFFSLGHSSVVIMTCVVIAATSAALADKFDAYQAIGGIVGTSVSMSFLLIIGLANCHVLYRLIRAMRSTMESERQQRKAQGSNNDTTRHTVDCRPARPIVTNGLLFRLSSRLFRLIDRPWKMYPLGILFGLGFDTSTEIALLGIASLQGGQGTPIYLIMVFPMLFTVGMMLIDTVDGAGMYMAYTSDVFKHDALARLYYAIVLTGMSVAVALTIGLIQMLSLIANTTHAQGPFWQGVDRAGESYDVIGGSIVGAFVLVVALSAVIHWFILRRGSRPNRDAEIVLQDNVLQVKTDLEPTKVGQAKAAEVQTVELQH